MSEHDFCVIGGGIVGLATARELLRRSPGARIVLLEKEARTALHQTGHNSGVIHAGIYYKPGSLKAKLCREGAEATKQFCRDHAIPFEACGKLLIATDADELTRMQALEKRAQDNGIAYELLDAGQLKAREPHVAGVGALFLPATGIVDYSAICAAMAADLTAAGVEIRLGTTVTAIEETGSGVEVRAGGEIFRAGRLIACAGLQSDRLARLAGLDARHRIIPFRGEYYVLPATRSGIVNHLIYPIPNPELPFLGIHLTRMIDGSVTVGPNAVLGFAREGYPKGSINFGDVVDMLGFPGFYRTIWKNLGHGIGEFGNSLIKRLYLAQCRKYCPSLTLADLGTPTAGIRAQAVMPDGTVVDDFLFLQSERMLHVCNAPSPAATSAMPIASMIVDRLLG